ncbi:hypothetical protein JRQ81_015926, partial [Phrynocephalus forsythii]
LEQEGAKSAEETKEIVALEQFYAAISGKLKYLVKEKHPITLQEAAEFADQINEIRNHGFDGPRSGRKGYENHKNNSQSEQGQHIPAPNERNIPQNENPRSD